VLAFVLRRLLWTIPVLFVVVTANLIVDIVQAYLDPSIREAPA
jgi:ABC-type dipeptide/oligopeptide/nickel transport system permease component